MATNLVTKFKEMDKLTDKLFAVTVSACLFDNYSSSGIRKTFTWNENKITKIPGDIVNYLIKQKYLKLVPDIYGATFINENDEVPIIIQPIATILQTTSIGEIFFLKK